MSPRARRWWRRAIAGTPRARALVLLYHRFAAERNDPWALCVSPAHFDEQLSLLARRYRVIPFERLVAEQMAGTLAPHTVAITIDDGYVDNLEQGAPRLARHDLPATLFVTTGAIGASRVFWWDELDRLLLAPGVLPERLEVMVGGERLTFSLGDAARYTSEDAERHRGWRSGEAEPTVRHALYRELWTRLYRVPNEEKLRVLGVVGRWANAARSAHVSPIAMTRGQLLELVRSAPVTLGAHGVTHDALDTCDAERQRWEIDQSKRWLEETLDAPVRTFAYPHGAYDDTTLRVVRELGIRGACTTRTAGVQRGDAPHELPRLHVRDWNGDDLEQQLLWWLGRGRHRGRVRSTE